MQISSIALGGLNASESQFNQAASDIVSSTTPGAGTQPDTVDLSTAAVNLLAAKQDFSANLDALKVGDDMTKKALDILG